VQEQIDAVVEDKILEALCGADTSEMVKVPSCSCLSKAFCMHKFFLLDVEFALLLLIPQELHLLDLDFLLLAGESSAVSKACFK